MIQLTNIRNLFTDAGKEWGRHNPLLLGAAISFYVILSIGPLLALIIMVLGEVFGKNAAEGQIIKEIQNIAGNKPSQIFQEIIQKASTASNKTMAILSSIPLMFFGTTMVFLQLRNALNIIWGVKDNTDGVKKKAKVFSFSFLMLFIIEILFFLLMVKSFILTYLSEALNILVSTPLFIKTILDMLFSYILFILLFAAVYKILIKSHIPGKVIWTGAAVTSLLFTIVQVLVGINADNSSIDSALGALGYFTILFIWIFYSSLVFLFGASFTKVYSQGKTSSGKEIKIKNTFNN